MGKITWENENVRLVVTFIIGIAVGIGGYWLAGHEANKARVAVLSANQEASTTEETQSSANSVSVENQTPGSSVTVASVTLAKPGWVAIHDDVNGQPGRILGAYLFDKGTHNGIVPLLRATVEGKDYFAVLHDDDGDYHHFSPKTDTSLTDADGKPIMVRFTAETSNSSEAATGTVTSYVNIQK